MDIARENKIRQNIALSIDKDEEEYTYFMDLISSFVKERGKQEIEGTIDKIHVDMGYDNDIRIKIVTLKEDKLGLIENRS